MPRLPRIPDLLTTANLACGVGSILVASQGQLTWACWLVFAGALFDVFDGLAARALGGGTPLGAQLDSLADMVTFGVAPGMIVHFMLSRSFDLYWSPGTLNPQLLAGGSALLIPIASAWRLAKFNIDTRQSSSFLGLPTPANGLFWAGLCLGLLGLTSDASMTWHPAMILWQPWLMIACVIVLCTLMLSELPLPSLKFKHFKWKGNEVMFLLLGIGLVLVVLYGVLAVPLILVLYLLSPLWGKAFARGNATSSH